MRAGIVLALVVLATMVSLGAAGQEALEQAAAEHVGEVITLCGHVAANRCEVDQPLRLALEKPLEAPGVSVIIPAAERLKLGPGFTWRASRKEVCATGRVTRNGKRFDVLVSDAADVRINSVIPPAVANVHTLCDPGVVSPRVLQQAKPAYTAEALRLNIQGSVMLGAVVMPNGTLTNIRVERSLDDRYGLDDSAIDAARQWRFTPGTVSGQPVPVAVALEMAFIIKK
jgi:TonB family protein